MLRERIQLDDKGRLLRGRFYFYRIFVCKYKVSYPNSGAGAMVTLYLFGFLPIGRFALSEQMFMQGCIGGGLTSMQKKIHIRCFTYYGAKYCTGITN